MLYVENQLSFQEIPWIPKEDESSEELNQTYLLISPDLSLGLPKKPTEDTTLPSTMPQMTPPTTSQ